MTKTYNDPVKQKTREKLEDFIRRNILLHKKPEEIKVLCFPGAEQDGEEAIEVKEVYDKLGIKRENITGLEIEKTRYERLKKANLGIEVVFSSDIDFLEEERGRTFDVISLDYTSFFTEGICYALSMIAGQQFLAKRGILCTNVMAARENEEAKEIIKWNKGFKEKNPTVLEILNKHNEVIKKIEETPLELKEDRANTLARLIGCLFLKGRMAISVEPFKIFKHAQQMIKNIHELFKKDPEQERKNCYGRNIEEKLALCKESRTQIYSGAIYSLAKVGLLPHEVDLFMMILTKPYFIEALESYNYISNSRTPMLLNLFYLDQHRTELQRLADYFSIQSDEDGLCINILPAEYSPTKRMKIKKQVKEKIEELVKKMTDFYSKEIKPVYLGSSYQPPQKEKISEADVIDLLKSECSPDEIWDCYSGFTKKQLEEIKEKYLPK